MADNFRALNEYEKNLILSELSIISDSLRSHIEQRKSQLFVLIPRLDKQEKYPQIFMIQTPFHEKVLNFQIKENIEEIGIYFGFIKRGNFFLSIEAAQYFEDLHLIPEGIKIYLNEKGSKAILYGNNIEKGMVEEFPSNLRKNKIYFIFNPFKELIAVGLSLIEQIEIEDLQINGNVAINLIDKGYYLREEQ